jgi:hypothetical protein
MSGVALLNALPLGRLKVVAPVPTDARAWSWNVYGIGAASALLDETKTTEDEAMATPKPRAAEVVRRISLTPLTMSLRVLPGSQEGQLWLRHKPALSRPNRGELLPAGLYKSIKFHAKCWRFRG